MLGLRHFFSLNGNIGSLNAHAASWGNKATVSTRQGGLAHSRYCSCDHLAVATLASPALVDVFKREVASWVFVLEDLEGERLGKESTRRNAYISGLLLWSFQGSQVARNHVQSGAASLFLTPAEPAGDPAQRQK